MKLKFFAFFLILSITLPALTVKILKKYEASGAEKRLFVNEVDILTTPYYLPEKNKAAISMDPT